MTTTVKTTTPARGVLEILVFIALTAWLVTAMTGVTWTKGALIAALVSVLVTVLRVLFTFLKLLVAAGKVADQVPNISSMRK